MIIKINFTGAQGTGKTTILNALKSHPGFQGFEFVTEVVRNFVKEKGIKINKEGTVETQQTIFEAYKELLDRKDHIDGEGVEDALFVSDRCIIDVIAYTTSGLKNLKEETEEHSNFADCLWEQKNVLRERKDDIGYVFYFPIEFPIEDDSTRSTDIAYQKEIDENIMGLLETEDIPYITITGTVEERIAIIERTIFE